MSVLFPSAETVATVIVAACKITGADPFGVAHGEVARGRAGTEVSRARAYAALALKEVHSGCGGPSIARMVGTRPQSVASYVGSLEASRRNGLLNWLDDGVLRDLVALIRLSPKFETPAEKFVASAAQPAVVTPKERGRVFSHEGITVDFTEGEEYISHAGKTADVSPRQALLFEALAKGMPNPIGRDFLRHRLFGPGGSQMQKDVQLDLVVGDARHAAQSVGLIINGLKGIGFSLARVS